MSARLAILRRASAAVVVAQGIGLGAGGALAQQGTDYPDYPPIPGLNQRDETANLARETVVAGLSSDAVAITASFDGSDILIYGAVRRETPIPKGKPLDVIVTVQGPSESITMRRKSRRLGIWINTDSVAVGAVPHFYAVVTTGPLDQILDPDFDTRYRISIPMAMRSLPRPVEVSDPTAFTEAMTRIKADEGEFVLDQGGVGLVDQTLFRADIAMPANLIEGAYKTRIFLLRDGQVIDSHSDVIDVRKVGLERWLYRLAFDHPLLYGLMSLAIAALAGWAASFAARMFKRG